jgi:nicotinic acid mononucleotide adenylyltransferase
MVENATKVKQRKHKCHRETLRSQQITDLVILIGGDKCLYSNEWSTSTLIKAMEQLAVVMRNKLGNRK